MNFSDIELPSYQHSDPEALMNSEVGHWRVNISTVEHIGPIQRKIFEILNTISGLRVNWWGKYNTCKCFIYRYCRQIAELLDS